MLMVINDRHAQSIACWYMLPLRIRAILYGSVSGGSESHALLSSTHPHNELMRLYFLRRQNEWLLPTFKHQWQLLPAFSFNLRFLIVIINDYFVRSPLSSTRNFSESPKKPIGFKDPARPVVDTLFDHFCCVRPYKFIGLSR